MTAEILTRLQASLAPCDRTEAAADGLKAVTERLTSLEEQFRCYREKERPTTAPIQLEGYKSKR